METATIISFAALGWLITTVALWWWMLMAYNREHAKVLKLEGERGILRAELRKLEAEAKMAQFPPRAKSTDREPAPKCDHCDKRMEWDAKWVKWVKWVCLCKVREKNAQPPG